MIQCHFVYSISTAVHITQIIPKLHAGGAEIGCIAIAKALIDQGHQASIITSGGQYIQSCQDHGILIHILPVNSKNPANILANAKAIKTFAKVNKTDLFHVRSRAPAWSIKLAAQQQGLPWLSTYHGAYRQTNQLKYYYNRIMTQGHATIAPSNFMQQHILEHYPEIADKLHTIPRGINLQDFTQKQSNNDTAHFRAQHRLHKEAPLILLPGRLSALKGHHVALQAIQIIAPLLRQQQAQCLFLGDQSKTNYVQQLKQTSQKQKIDDLIAFLPHSNNMAQAFQAAQITLNCSTQAESFGRTIVEAQASESLIIASKHGGALDNIIHKKTGLLFKPGQAQDLAQQIKYALTLKDDERRKIINNAKQHALENACDRKMVQKTLALYRSLLNTNS